MSPETITKKEFESKVEEYVAKGWVFDKDPEREYYDFASPRMERRCSLDNWHFGEYVGYYRFDEEYLLDREARELAKIYWDNLKWAVKASFQEALEHLYRNNQEIHQPPAEIMMLAAKQINDKF